MATFEFWNFKSHRQYFSLVRLSTPCEYTTRLNASTIRTCSVNVVYFEEFKTPVYILYIIVWNLAVLWSSNNLTNSMAWVRERTLRTERPPLVGEVIANFFWVEGATWSASRIPPAVFSVF
jgi:hypothetical protein